MSKYLPRHFVLKHPQTSVRVSGAETQKWIKAGVGRFTAAAAMSLLRSIEGKTKRMRVRDEKLRGILKINTLERK
jgi:hypothetical protein